MAVKTARINTVSFSYSNVAKNGLVCKPGDVLTLVEGAGGQMYVDLATPESLIWGICDDKKVFSETNETKELDRVNYTPIAWDNTYKMEVSGEGTPKVGFFYTMTDDQKIDLSTESNSVGQFMVQDINDAYIEVRFVVNQGLAVPQYEDVRLESIEETNPDSDPFDGLYTFTLSNGTQISGDFSALAWYLGDVTITGKLTVNEDLQTLGNTEIGGTLEVTGNSTLANVETQALESTTIETSGDITAGANVSVTGNETIAGNETVTGTITAGDTTVSSITSTGNATIDGNTTIQGTLTAGNTTVNGTVSATGNISGSDISGENAMFDGTLTATGNTRLSGTLTVDEASNFKKSVDIDVDLNVDGSAYIGGSTTVDEDLTVNNQLILGPNASAPQFILQTEKNQPNGVAALNASGKVSESVLPPLAIGETFVVDSEANMLALTAQTGDLCIRTDISKTFVKLNDNNPSTLADWQQLQTSGEVISVNGQTGAVVLDADDIDDATTTNKFVTDAEKTTWNAKQNAIGYTPENQANRDTVTLVNSTDHYPSSAVVKTLLDGKQNNIGYTPENITNKDTATITDSSTKYPSSHVVLDALNTKQATLVSGDNIKTINNQSLLGSGNIDLDVNIAFYYETTSAGAATYTLQHTPISDSSIMVFTDSGTALFPTTDYTCANGVITFSNLGASEHAIIRVVSAN